MRNSLKLGLGAGLIIAVSGYLALQGLADNYFWDDEAGTAIFARNLLHFGKLTAWDGRNLMAYRNGSELDREFINKYFPPLQFVITAASFRVLGVSTFTARLPFALIGFFSLWLLFLWLKKESGGNPTISLCGQLLLALSPSFLLFIRQCRYFALTIFFPLLIYFYYRRYLLTGKVVYLVIVTVGFIGLFFSHYLICAAFAFALLGVHLKYHLRAGTVAPLGLAAAIFAGIVGLYICLHGFALPPAEPLGPKRWLLGKLVSLGRNFREMNSYHFFPWSMVLVIVWMLGDRSLSQRWQQLAKEWGLLIVLFVVCLSLFSPQPVVTGGSADVRYLVALFPFLAGLLGLIIFFLRQKSRPAAVVVLLGLVFSNLFALNFWFPRSLRWDLLDYLGEIHRDYTTPYEAAVRFMEKNFQPDATVVVVPPNMSYPLQFYLGDRFRFGGRVQKNTRLPLDRVRKLNPSLILEESRPDWIISFRWRRLTEELLDFYARGGMAFELQAVLDVYFLGEMIRPELLLHSFKPVFDFDPASEGVLIFKHR